MRVRTCAQQVCRHVYIHVRRNMCRHAYGHVCRCVQAAGFANLDRFCIGFVVGTAASACCAAAQDRIGLGGSWTEWPMAPASSPRWSSSMMHTSGATGSSAVASGLAVQACKKSTETTRGQQRKQPIPNSATKCNSQCNSASHVARAGSPCRPEEMAKSQLYSHGV